MAFTEYKSFSAQTISTAKYSLVNNSTSIATDTTAGVYQLQVDVANMVAGDQYQFTAEEKVVAGGTQRTSEIAVLTGAQPGPLIFGSPGLLNGWDFTAKRLAGADRTFSWSIRRAA